jgi:hypothetical protein
MHNPKAASEWQSSIRDPESTLPLTAAAAFCSILGTSSLFGANLNFMQSG